MTGERSPEANEILKTYAARDRSIDLRRYSPLLAANIVMFQERERVFLRGLAKHGHAVLDDADVLEVGCGAGGELARLVAYGATPARLHGIDLRPDAIDLARRRISADLVVGDASALPWPDASFDLVVQMTALSSMVKADMRQAVAAEMRRVLRHGGLIVSYDFWANPRNRDTVGIDRAELRRLFPGARIDARRVTLAPPIARRIAPVSMRLAGLVGLLPPLRTHYIAFIDPCRTSSR